MTLEFDLFWSFRSPYCYLALDRILAIHQRFEVDVAVRPVYPLAIRAPDAFKSLNPLYRPYHTLDSRRMAEHLGLPFRRPVPDPVVFDAETGRAAPDQPHIRRVTRLAQAAARAGRGLPFLDTVMRLLWDGGTEGWDEGGHLSDAIARAGLDGQALEKEAAERPAELDALIEANHMAQEAAGHWGVPLMAFRGEPFFGQDRIETLLWRMRQQGLRERR